MSFSQVFMAAASSSDNSRRAVVLQTAVVVVVVSAVVGLISTLLMVKLLPSSCEIVLSSIAGFWNSIRCVLSSPLYICIIINSMVLLIAASSAFHRHETDNHHDSIVIQEPPPPLRELADVEPPPPLETPPSRTSKKCSKLISATSTFCQDTSCDHDDSVSTHIFHHSASQDSIEESFCEESLVSEAHKIKKIEYQHGKENEEDDDDDNTMDATWKAITGGEKKGPNRKQLNKSETWDFVHAPPPPIIVEELLPPPSTIHKAAAAKELRKSETFNETKASIRQRGGGGTIRRDPSVGRDELNHQVEAFIKKFNKDMRLQRQESDQRFLDMIKRGL